MSKRHRLYIIYAAVLAFVGVLFIGGAMGWFKGLDGGGGNVIGTGGFDFALVVEMGGDEIVNRPSVKAHLDGSGEPVDFAVPLMNSTVLDAEDESDRDTPEYFNLYSECMSVTVTNIKTIAFDLEIIFTDQEGGAAPAELKYRAVTGNAATALLYAAGDYHAMASGEYAVLPTPEQPFEQVADSLAEDESATFYFIFWVDGIEMNSGEEKPQRSYNFEVRLSFKATQSEGGL